MINENLPMSRKHTATYAESLLILTLLCAQGRLQVWRRLWRAHAMPKDCRAVFWQCVGLWYSKGAWEMKISKDEDVQ